MALFWQIAWRSVFRNRRRSAIIVTAVAVGVAGVLFMILFSAGMMDQMVAAVVRSTGHLQVEAPHFRDDPGVDHALHETAGISAALAADPVVADWAPRVIARGLARSAGASAGVEMRGVAAVDEARMTHVDQRLVEGRWLADTPPRRKEIVVGTKLAAKLGVRLGQRVVLTLQGRGGMTSAVFRVAGIFRMPAAAMNEALVYVHLADAQQVLEMGADLSQVAVMLHDGDDLTAAATALATRLDGDAVAVHTWHDGNRSLVQMVDLFEVSILVYVVIVFLGAAFGIVNTMLMAVFERTRELGILRAVGTGRWALFRMVVYEALAVSVLGIVAGVGLMAVLYKVWLVDGLDLSMFAESLALFGADAVIVPAWHTGMFLESVAAVLVMSVASAIWPAVRAARVQPAEAMRSG